MTNFDQDFVLSVQREDYTSTCIHMQVKWSCKQQVWDADASKRFIHSALIVIYQLDQFGGRLGVSFIPNVRTLSIFNFYGLGRIEYGSIDVLLIRIKDF